MCILGRTNEYIVAVILPRAYRIQNVVMMSGKDSIKDSIGIHIASLAERMM